MVVQPNTSEARERAKLAAELLPPGPGREWLWPAVERILAEPLGSPAQLVAYHDDRADICRRFAAQLPTMESICGREALFAQISEQEQQERQLTESYKRLPANYPRTRMRQVELLLAWETAGGDLDYQRGRKKATDSHFPDPTGQVISFLVRTAAVAASTTHNIIIRYGQFHLMPIVQTQLGGAGSLIIDESKIYLVARNGNVVTNH
jgi:hypothetical protein